ncbi:hypothetical protein CC2G_002234 [Coprinopsis cinerea AmutBmut pab1-1]|nr:hypothetical protein CC2G_002234 [Coprinopsis cinerea AmutBmut pab1-1]
MAKLWVPSTIVLVCALVLSFLVSLSLPWLSALDISRVAITDDRVGDIVPWLSKDIRFGVWTACSWDFDDKKECVPRGTGYTAPIGAFENVEEKDFEIVTLTPGWTRGLAIHPVVTGVIGLALGASLSTRHTVNLFAPLICVLAAAITLIAFAIDIALHLRVRSLINRFDIPDGAPIKIAPGPGEISLLSLL